MANELQYDLSGRVAIVTGGLSGIGAAIVEALRTAGANVSTWDLAAPATVNDGCYRVDVSDASSVEQAAAAILDQYGSVDIVVNNAGIAGSTGPVETYDPAEWQQILAINLTGTFNVCRRLVPALKANGYGRIVNIASLAGKEGTPNAAAYSASKAGVIALTKSLGKELAGTGVLVNAIAPAAVQTALLDQMSVEHVATMIAKSPMKRTGTADEVAAQVLWLSSDACSFSTGAVFDLSGGRATY